MISRARTRPLLAFALAFVLLGGCGYRLVRYGASPDGLAGVCVQTFENDSLQPGLELLVSEALRKELLRRGGARLESDSEGAELVISGRVRPVVRSGKSFSTTVLALEYSVAVQLDVELRFRDGGRLRLDPSSLRDSESYLSSADVEVERKNRQESMRRVAQVLAARIWDAIDLDRVVKGKAKP
jgi:hypothetical protein